MSIIIKTALRALYASAIVVGAMVGLILLVELCS